MEININKEKLKKEIADKQRELKRIEDEEKRLRECEELNALVGNCYCEYTTDYDDDMLTSTVMTKILAQKSAKDKRGWADFLVESIEKREDTLRLAVHIYVASIQVSRPHSQLGDKVSAKEYEKFKDEVIARIDSIARPNQQTISN